MSPSITILEHSPFIIPLFRKKLLISFQKAITTCMLSLAELHQKKRSSIDKVEAFRLQQQSMLEQGQRWFLLPTTLVVIGAVLLFIGRVALGAFGFGLSVVVFLLVGAFKILPAYTRFNDQFKRQVLYALLEDLYPSVYYAPDNYIPSSLFVKAQLYPQGTSYTGKDYVEGETTKGDTFKFSALMVQEKKASSGKSTALFEGLFLVIDLAEPLDCPVFILPSTSPTTTQEQLLQQPIERFFTDEQSSTYNAVDSVFGQGFMVYSQKKEAAQLLLKAPLIEAIYQWHTQWNCAPHISLIGQQLFVALPIPVVFPAPDFVQQAANNVELNRFYDQVIAGLSVVELFGEANKKKDTTRKASVPSPKEKVQKDTPPKTEDNKSR